MPSTRTSVPGASVAPISAFGLGPVRAVTGVEAVSSAPVVIAGAVWLVVATAGAAPVAAPAGALGCDGAIVRSVPCRICPMSLNVCSRSGVPVESAFPAWAMAAVEIKAILIWA
jgi:hypothetical protein